MGEKKRRLAAAMATKEQVAAAANLLEAGRLHEARDLYDRVLRADPACAGAWLGMAQLASQSGAADASLPLFAKAVALDPGNAAARVQYASALQQREDFDTACVQLRAACELQPSEASYWESLGILEQAAGNIDAAVAAYRRSIAIEPTPARRVKTATAIAPIPSSRAAIAAERARMAAVLDELLAEGPKPQGQVPDPFAASLWTNFYLAYHGENDRDLQVKTAAVYRRICPSLDYVAPHCRAQRTRGGRIKVGLISNFLRNHSIGRTSRGLFARLSREHFEVSAIFVAPAVDDAFSQMIRRDAEHALVVPRDLQRAREAIAALQLDVLFYQDIGMEPFTYFLAYARLAPVQCVSFGHPDTTGIPTIDYFVSNDWYEPPDAAAHYSETLYLLRGLPSLAYYYRPQLREPRKPRAAFGLPDERNVYLCPQNLFKVHPDMDPLIAAILRGDPNGIVVLVEGRVRNWSRLLRARWGQAMADVQDRIRFVPRMHEDDYLNLIALADVMLDTVHFNGMNTSLEALAVGTPVVTLPTAYQRGRHTQAMYRCMGMDDLVAADAPAYVNGALRLANDRDWRAAVVERIRDRSAVLFENPAVVREFERFFRDVARR